jgi:hypothetical protein
MKRDLVNFMPTIYRKTAKGVAEIETRAHRLSPRLRTALIMVDGKKSDVELAAMLGPAAEALVALAQEGFIEAAAQVLAAPPPSAAPARPVPPPAPAPVAASAPKPGSDFEPRRRAVLRAFNDLVGPAGETLAIRIEKAKTIDEVRALFPQAARLVELVRGRSAAEDFAARVDEM